MQGGTEHPVPERFEDSTRQNAATGTSHGVINLNFDCEEEWFFYEELTEAIINRFKRNSRYRQPTRLHNNAKCMENSNTERRIEKESGPTEVITDEQADGDKTRDFVSSLPMRKSLFPHVAPYVIFHSHDCKCSTDLPKDIAQHLKWKLTASTPRIVMKILTKSGYPVVNSFPGSHNLGNKDILWTHLNKLKRKFGPEEYDFMPKTYILPKEMRKFESMWQKYGIGNKWIVKPPAAGRGQGVKVINQWWEIPKWHSVIVQRYISRPRLINGSKFDLRVYVLVTSINPTRIYIYDEGLVRFASVRYIRGTMNLSDRYMHLTNTSVNKLNPAYVINDGVHSYRGHKWSFKSLWSYLRDDGVDVPNLWSKIKDIVIKTVIAAEPSMNATISGNVISSYTCYELYGFDVLLDENYKPWLLEVNVLPSLQTDSPLDLTIKGSLIRNVLNMAGYQIPKDDRTTNGRKASDICNSIVHDYKLYSTSLSLQEKTKQNEINAMEDRDEYLNSILVNLTRDDLRHLIRYEDEISQSKNFQRLFPTENSYVYLQFFQVQRYYDRLLDAWEHCYSKEREKGIERLQMLCEDMLHLQPTTDE